MGAQGPRLVLGSEPHSGKAFDLPRDGVLRAGTSASCQIHLEGQNVLEVHCIFKCQAGRVAVFVKEPGAALKVNGASVQKKLLEPGDTIQAGEAVLLYEAGAKDRLVGKVLAGYRIEELLGHGAMGTVYKATQLSLDRCVALKILSPELTKDKEFVGEFLSEARAAAKLNHPNVVQVYDAGAAPDEDAGGEERSLYFFSMEFLPGGTVAKLLEREVRLSLEKALEIARDTAKALVWAEEHGIVHRDIKPDNLLFAGDGAVKVADLGIAADLYGSKGKAGDGEKRQRGVGSPRYMAPEQAIGKPVDHRADIYSLGSTIYRVLAGRAPFEGKTAAEVLKAKATLDPPPLDSLAPDVPPSVGALIARMIARDPDGRPATCLEVLSDLEEMLASAKGGRFVEAGADSFSGDWNAEATAEPASRRRRGAGAGTDDVPYVETLGGKVSLLTSGLMVLSAVIFSVVWTPNQDGKETALSPIAVETRDAGEPLEPVDAVADAATVRKSGKTPQKTDGGAGEQNGQASSAQIAVLRKLSTIENDWKAGFLDARKATEQIEAFKREHPDPIFQERADRTLAFIRDVRVKAGQSKLAKLLTKDVEPLLKEGKLGEAEKKLAGLEAEYPELAEAVRSELKKLEEAAAAAWTRTEAEADRRIAAGEFDPAVALLKETGALLPPPFEKRVVEKIGAVERARKDYVELSKLLSGEIEKVKDAATALDFEKAVSIASAIPEPKSPLLALRRALLIEESRRAKEAWDALKAAVGRKAAGGEPVTIAFAEAQGTSPPAPYRLKGLNGASLSLQAASASRAEARDIFTLSSKSLLELLGGGGDAPAAGTIPPRVLEGLGLLVLQRQGPQRAADLLLDPRLSAEKLEAYKVRLKEEEEAFPGRLARAVEARMARIAKQPAASRLPEWEALAADLATAIPNCRKLSGYEKVKEGLAKSFTTARMECLEVSAPQSLFAGKVQSYKPDGSIEILYDFNSEDERKDFRSVKASSQIEVEEGKAKLRGEFRIGRGEVFRKRIDILVKVPSDGYSPQSPNINIALWTSDADKLSPKIPASDQDALPDPDEALAVPAGLPQDYLVFATGYRAHVYNPRHRAFEYLSLRGNPTPVQMPANALIGGRKGMRVHGIPEEDCVWAANVQSKIKGAQVIRIVMSGKPGELPVWTINQQRVPLKDARGADILKRSEPYSGSVTFFTNGEIIYFESVLIEGELNPGWIESQLLAMAEKDLKKIEPAYPFKDAAADPQAEWERLLEGTGSPPGDAPKAKAGPGGAPAPELTDPGAEGR